MSKRLSLLICAALVATVPPIAGCHSRSVSADDAAPDSVAIPGDARLVDDGPAADARPADARPPDAAAGLCRSLAIVGTATLGQAPPEFNGSASIAHDGAGFAVTWVADASSSALSGRLLFSRIDHAAKIQIAQPVELDKQVTKVPAPQIVARQAEFGVLFHRGAVASLVRVDSAGKVLGGSFVHFGAAAVDLAQVVAHPGGYAALYSTHSPALFFRLFDATGTGSPTTTTVGTGGSYAYLGLASNASAGFSATWGSSLQRLDANGALVGTTVIAVGKQATSGPSYALAPAGGYGVVYARSSDFLVEGLRLDATGKPLGQPVPIAQANIGAAPLQQLFLASVGDGFALAYPGSGPGGRARVQLLDSTMAVVGASIEVPLCLSWAGGPVAAAFGAGHFAVASIGGFSGPVGSAVCVAVLACR